MWMCVFISPEANAVFEKTLQVFASFQSPHLWEFCWFGRRGSSERSRNFPRRNCRCLWMQYAKSDAHMRRRARSTSSQTHIRVGGPGRHPTRSRPLTLTSLILSPARTNSVQLVGMLFDKRVHHTSFTDPTFGQDLVKPAHVSWAVLWIQEVKPLTILLRRWCLSRLSNCVLNERRFDFAPLHRVW